MKCRNLSTKNDIFFSVAKKYIIIGGYLKQISALLMGFRKMVAASSIARKEDKKEKKMQE